MLSKIFNPPGKASSKSSSHESSGSGGGPKFPEIALWFLTWPYYHTLQHYTIHPIRKIVAIHEDESRLRRVTNVFLRGKVNEVKLVVVASTLSAGASLISFSWTAVERSSWVVFAFWYLSLILAIFGVFTAAQQVSLIYPMIQTDEDLFTTPHYQAILKLVASEKIMAKESDKEVKKDVQEEHSKAPQNDDNVSETQELTPEEAPQEPTREAPEPPAEPVKEVHASLLMTYIWQNPVMHMSYSVLLFLLGLIVHFTAPLRHDTVGIHDSRISIFVLVLGGIVGLNYAVCSFYLHRSATNARSINEIDEEKVEMVTEVAGPTGKGVGKWFW